MKFVVCGPSRYQSEHIISEPVSSSFHHESSTTRIDCGGHAATMARAIMTLGHEATFVTLLGDGPKADECREILLNDEVDVIDLVGVGDPPVSSIIYSAGQEPLVVTGVEDGREHEYPSPDVLDDAQALILDQDLGGIQLPLARQAKEADIPIIVHLDRDHPDNEALVSLATHVILSPRVAFGGHGFEPMQIVSEVYHRGPQFVARTAGPDPIIVATDDQAYQIPVPSLQADEIADVIGASSVLTAGFAVSFADGNEPLQALVAGAQLATVSLKYHGALGWVRALNER